MSRKIPMKGIKSDLAWIFKSRFDRLGFSTWKEFTDKLGLENPRTFIDFFNGGQCISKETLEKAFKELNIPLQLLEIYTEPVIKYKVKEEN